MFKFQSTTATDSAPLTNFQVIAIFLAVLTLVFLLAFFKKIWYRLVYKKRYYIIPRTQIKGIANIAMVISMTIGIIFSLTIISANGLGVIFRAYAGTRMQIESILIRIGGLLFGPFMGVFIGAITDLLTVILTSGIFHYGYFISAMAYGLVSGLIKTLMIYSKKKNFSFAIGTTTFIVILMISSFLFFHLQSSELYKIDFFIKLPPLPKDLMLYTLIGFFALSILVIWALLPLAKRKSLKGHKQQFIDIEGYGKVEISKKGHNTTDTNWYVIFLSTFAISILCQIFIDLFMLPFFDVTLSTINYNQWLAIRFLTAIPFIIFNTILTFFVYKIICPLIKYEYVDDMVENKNQQIFYK